VLKKDLEQRISVINQSAASLPGRNSISRSKSKDDRKFVSDFVASW